MGLRQTSRWAGGIVLGVLASWAAVARGPVWGAAESRPLVLDIPTSQLTVVKTVEELKKTPRLSAGPVGVRLGLQADRCAQGSAVLLYCQWADGEYDNNDQRSRMTQWRQDNKFVGPVKLRVTEVMPEGKTGREAGNDFGMRGRWGGGMGSMPWIQRDGDGIYAVSIPVAHKAKYIVEVLAADESPVARGTVEGTDEKAPVWFRMHSDKGPPAPNPNGQRNEANDAPAEAITLGTDAYVPKWEGIVPFHVTNKNLPVFLPDEPDAGLKLTYKEGELALAFDSSAGRGAEFYLIRWWVNGKPAAAGERKPDVPVQQNFWYGQPADGKVTVRWTIDAKRSGVNWKAGDKIEAQVLYCRDCSEPAPGSKATAQWMPQRQQPSIPVRLSNKVEWEVK